MPDIPQDKLSAKDRRIALARRDYESLFSIPGIQLADEFGVSGSSITLDRQEADYIDELLRLSGGRLNRIGVKSWLLVEAVIDEGLAGVTAEMPRFDKAEHELRWVEAQQKTKDRAAKMVQWYLEKSGEVAGVKGSESSTLDDIRALINKADE